MRHKEGGQKYGNQEIVTRMTRELFDIFVRPLVKPKNFKEYMKKYPDQTYLSLFRRATDPNPSSIQNWHIKQNGPFKDVRPDLNSGWVIRVNSFDSPKARQQGRMADSDISNLDPRTGNPLN